MVDLAPLNVRITADPDSAIAGLKRVEGQLENTGRAATTAQAKTKAASGSLSLLGSTAGQQQFVLRNLAYQFNQIGQQAAVTGNFMGALSVQLPDILSSFGGLKLVLAGGAIALASQFLPALFNSSAGAKTLQENIEALSEAVGRYQEYANLAGLETDKLAERFGSAGARAQEVAGYLAEWARIDAVEALDAAVAKLSEGFGSLGGDMIDVTDQTRGMVEAILGSGIEEYSLEMLDTIRRLAEEFGIASEEAYVLAQAMQDFATADSVQGQVDAAAALSRQFIAVFGSVERIPPELREVARQAGLIALEAAEIEGAFDASAVAAFDVKGAVDAIVGATNSAITSANSLTTAWGNVATNAWEAAKAMAASRIRMDGMSGSEVANLAAQYGAYGQGQQAFRNRVQGGLGDITGGIVRPQLAGPSGGGGGGGGGGAGGGGVNPLIAELEAVQQALMTQEELQLQSFERQQETLQQALEQRLLTQQEYNGLIEDAQRQHADRMAELDAYRYGTGLDQAEQFFGDAAQALASGNQKMVEISRKFAAAEALINAGRAFAQVASDPSLPWFAKIPAALGVASAISQFAGKSGIGGSLAGAGIGQQQGAASAAPSQYLSVTLEGQSFGRSSVESIFDMINEGLDQGYNLKGIRVV